ncbi:proline-rich protein PRCC [Carcharodon carcharias]|uniref:proline-rich protein PRCC n=1 Tax=Carcharodon carcharias TaxID=13397 RepID=UPI001B7ED5EB|nr:proline-rich protein PRCC [Carcharodon carcharias]
MPGEAGTSGIPANGGRRALQYPGSLSSRHTGGLHFPAGRGVLGPSVLAGFTPLPLRLTPGAGAAAMSLVAYGSSSGSEGGESEGEGESASGETPARRRPQQAGALALSLAGARGKKRSGGNEPVQIRVPELQSDSDDEEPVQKRTSQSAGSGTGLSALLPQPRNLTLKETNRPLLPYSFTKKTAGRGSGQPRAAQRATVTTTPSPSAIKAASKNAAKQLAKHIMNEEAPGEEVSFFSLSDPEQPPPPGARTPAFAGESPLPALPQVPAPAPGLPGEGGEAPPDPLNPADAPLEFNRSAPSASDGGFPAASGSPTNPGPEFGNQYVDYNAQGTEQSEYYQDYYSSYYQEPDPALAPAPEEELNTFMNDEAFKRLQGKRNHSKEEVSFVEIKGDDQLSGSQQWLMKSLSEEKDMKSFSKKRGEQPTSQQRRKHQITYLIHQAKERELELKNAWSDNRLTKRQTQAKYGF